MLTWMTSSIAGDHEQQATKLKRHWWNEELPCFSAGKRKQNCHFTWASAGNNHGSEIPKVVGWVSEMLNKELKQKRINISKQSLLWYEVEGIEFLRNIVTRDEKWAHHFRLENKEQSIEYCKKVRFQFLTAVSMKITALWDMVPRTLVEVHQHSRGVHCLHHQGDDGQSSPWWWRQ